MNGSLFSVNKVAAVIPALNESATIDPVVKGLLPYTFPIVVDDGSIDETANIARKRGADVVKHSINQGYDRALETGLFRAIELGFEFAITVDADGQHNPELAKLFANELLNGADLVVGVRDRHQRFGESLFAIVSKILWDIKDPLCGMKGYRLSLLQQVGHFDSYTSIGTEFTIRAVRSGCQIIQLPVLTRQRSGVTKFGSGLRVNWMILRALVLGMIRARSFAKVG